MMTIILIRLVITENIRPRSFVYCQDLGLMFSRDDRALCYIIISQLSSPFFSVVSHLKTKNDQNMAISLAAYLRSFATSWGIGGDNVGVRGRKARVLIFRIFLRCPE